MFDWFGKAFGRRGYSTDPRTDLEKIGDDMSKVIPFPEPKSTPPMPAVEPPAKVFYRLGVTDRNRLSFQMGYSELTMNREGVQNLIDQLQVFRDQLKEEDEE